MTERHYCILPDPDNGRAAHIIAVTAAEADAGTMPPAALCGQLTGGYRICWLKEASGRRCERCHAISEGRKP
jgi:hypothetical protein